MPNLASKPFKVAHTATESVDFAAFLFVSVNNFRALVFYYHNQLSAGERERERECVTSKQSRCLML